MTLFQNNWSEGGERRGCRIFQQQGLLICPRASSWRWRWVVWHGEEELGSCPPVSAPDISVSRGIFLVTARVG